MNESELIQAARGGDEAAFEQLVRLHEKKIYNLCLRMCGSSEDAAEAAQDTFLALWRGLEGFREDAALSTWLYRLTSNLCIDFLRREKRRSGLSMTVSLDDEEEGRQADVPDERFSPEQSAERREVQELIRAGLRSLSEEHRRVLVLRELDGLSYAEIAQLLGLEEGTVKSRIARARLALRKYLIATGNFSSASSSTP